MRQLPKTVEAGRAEQAEANAKLAKNKVMEDPTDFDADVDLDIPFGFQMIENAGMIVTGTPDTFLL
jgi:hypothetical protein